MPNHWRNILVAILLFCRFFFAIPLMAQSAFSGFTIDRSTGEPLSFVNIQVKGTSRGVISDLQGRFTIALQEGDAGLQFSCVGYQTLFFPVDGFPSDGKVPMMPMDVKLSDVTVSPGMNPAFAVMRRVVEQAPQHNPNLNHNYSCVLYHKMVFSFEKPLPAQGGRVLSDFLLIEGVSEKKNQAPGKHAERMLSGRVSGFKEPSLAFVPAQIQPFTFYEPEVALLGEKYVNPLGQAGLRNYNFILEDTVWDASGDTILYISFFPKRGSLAKTLRGSFHIQLPDYVVKTATASTAQADAPTMLSIRQNYRRHDNGIWFPEELESKLRLSSFAASGGPVVASGRSYVTAVNFHPQFDRRTFSGPDFSDAGISTRAEDVDQYRYMPLTAADSATMHLMDSLSRRLPFDRLVNFQKELLGGAIPIGKVNLQYTRLLGYNDYEGVKTGVGLSTNDRLWPRFFVGGYGVYGFRDRQWKYGGDVRRVFKNDGSFRLWAKDDVAETGSFQFLDGFDASAPELFRNFLPETMDREQAAGAQLKWPLMRNLDGQLEYAYARVSPQMAYPFLVDGELEVAQGFWKSEVGLKLKWMPRQKQMRNAFGLFRQPSGWPVFWLNAAVGTGIEGTRFNYQRFEARVHQTFKLQSWTSTDIRYEGAVIEGSHPDAVLYSAMGNRKNFGLEIPFSFSTMRPNEFAVNRYQHLFFRHTLMPFGQSSGRFKPEIGLSANAGWSNSSDRYRTYNQGYYETGVVVDNLFSVIMIKYGLGVHYRLGTYQLPRQSDNWAINLSIRFAL